MNQWNLRTPPLHLWSRCDRTSKQRNHHITQSHCQVSKGRHLEKSSFWHITIMITAKSQQVLLSISCLEGYLKREAETPPESDYSSDMDTSPTCRGGCRGWFEASGKAIDHGSFSAATDTGFVASDGHMSSLAGSHIYSANFNTEGFVRAGGFALPSVPAAPTTCVSDPRKVSTEAYLGLGQTCFRGRWASHLAPRFHIHIWVDPWLSLMSILRQIFLVCRGAFCGETEE